MLSRFFNKTFIIDAKHNSDFFHSTKRLNSPIVREISRQLSEKYLSNRRKTLVKLINMGYTIGNMKGNEVF